MVSYQIKNKIKKVISVLNNNYFVETLHAVDNSVPDTANYNKLLTKCCIRSSYNDADSSKAMRFSEERLKKELENIKIRRLFVSMEEIVFEIKSLENTDFYANSGLNNLLEILDKFSETFEKYLGQGDPRENLDILWSMREVVRILKVNKKVFNFYISLFEQENHFPERDDCSEISILITSSMNLSEFILKLNSLDGIYQELCFILNISTSEFPLQIIKIESGSLWAKLFGHSKVIALIADFIKSGASYLYRNHTNEGKLSALPKKVEAIDSVLEFSKKMEENGIDTKAIKHEISKSAVEVSKQLNQLISGEKEIVVNDIKIISPSETHQNSIESKKTLKLEKSENNKKL